MTAVTMQEKTSAPVSVEATKDIDAGAIVTCKSSKDHSKPRNEVDTSLKSPV